MIIPLNESVVISSPASGYDLVIKNVNDIISWRWIGWRHDGFLFGVFIIIMPKVEGEIFYVEDGACAYVRGWIQDASVGADLP